MLAVVPNDWGTHWQRRHHLLSRIATYFRVGWVSPAAHWREGSGARPHEGEFTIPPERMHVCDRRDGLPTVYAPRWLADRSLAARVERMRRTLRSHGCQILVLQIWRPGFRAAVDPDRFDLTSYFIDDEYSFSDDATMSDRERDLISEAGLVVVSSSGLLESKGGINPNTCLVPNGVDFGLWSAPASEPDVLRDITRPRITFIGVLKQTLDWDLLSTLAHSRPDRAFVLVGPVRHAHGLAETVTRLGALPNVHVLPAKSPTELPAYAQHSDVCIMPYARGTHSVRTGYPLKVHEYLAAGVPVVGAPLDSILELRDVVSFADGAAQWTVALDEALSPDAWSVPRKNARRETARAHDWSRLARDVAVHTARALGPDCEDRLAGLVD